MIWSQVSACIAKTACSCTDSFSGEWDHFLYVGKIAFLGWFLHFGESHLRWSLNSISLCCSSVLDHGSCNLCSSLRECTHSLASIVLCSHTLSQLPTLYFSVLMFAHLVDHFVFSSRRWSERIKWIVFAVLTGAIVGCFWWFKGVAFGIEGPIGDHWGLRWRKVRFSFIAFAEPILKLSVARLGIYTTIRCTLSSTFLHPPDRFVCMPSFCIALLLSHTSHGQLYIACGRSTALARK